MRTVMLVAALLVLSQGASAHGWWIERDEGGCTLLSGHRHSEHEGAEVTEYDADWVAAAECFDARGERSECAVSGGYPARVEGDSAAVCFLVSSGYWTKTPYGTKNLPRSEVEQPVDSWLSYESVKLLSAWGEALGDPLTEWLEVTPTEDPFLLAEGDKVRLLVTLRGRPVAGAIVAYDGRARGTTADDGTVNVRLRHGGLQSISATHVVPVESDKADREIHTAFLNFDVGAGR